ncbi:hypothetical protein Hanom_Chr09g00860031 [Helianthus anomalus]
MDEEHSSASADNNTPEKVRYRYDEGGDKNVEYEGDEAEDGEIRSPEMVRPAPEISNRSPSEPLIHPVGEKSPEEEEAETVEVLHELHGESSIPRVTVNVHVGTEEVAAGGYGSGPHVLENCGNSNVDQLEQDGPTPVVGLGKRSREDRSPPSSGSMQGPPLRGFSQNIPSGEFSFDLNRPNADISYSFGDLMEENSHSQPVVNPEKVVTDTRSTRPPEFSAGQGSTPTDSDQG